MWNTPRYWTAWVSRGPSPESRLKYCHVVDTSPTRRNLLSNVIVPFYSLSALATDFFVSMIYGHLWFKRIGRAAPPVKTVELGLSETVIRRSTNVYPVSTNGGHYRFTQFYRVYLFYINGQKTVWKNSAEHWEE